MTVRNRQRLSALEKIATRQLEQLHRRGRVAIARVFAECGDPCEYEGYDELTSEWRTRFVWLYAVWCDNPENFVAGIADDHFFPEPPPVGELMVPHEVLL